MIWGFLAFMREKSIFAGTGWTVDILSCSRWAVNGFHHTTPRCLVVLGRGHLIPLINGHIASGVDGKTAFSGGYSLADGLARYG